MPIIHTPIVFMLLFDNPEADLAIQIQMTTASLCLLRDVIQGVSAAISREHSAGLFQSNGLIFNKSGTGGCERVDRRAHRCNRQTGVACPSQVSVMDAEIETTMVDSYIQVCPQRSSLSHHSIGAARHSVCRRNTRGGDCKDYKATL